MKLRDGSTLSFNLSKLSKLVVVVGGVNWGVNILDFHVYSPLIAVLAVVATVMPFLYFLSDDRRLLDLSFVSIVTAGTLSMSYYLLPPQTDEESLLMYAAYLFEHGVNPYTANLLPAYKVYPVSVPVTTATLSTFYYVNTFQYPALSFELVALAHPQVITFVSTVLFYLVLRLLGYQELFFAVSVFYPQVVFHAYTGGALDPLAFYISALAVLLTDDRRVWAGAFALAGAVKQFPLLFIPFVLKDLWGRWREFGQALALSLTLFLLPNLPFLIQSPSPWLLNVLAVVTAPIGQQGVSLSLLSVFGAYVPKAVYSVAFVAMYLVLLLMYRRGSVLMFFLPSLIWLVSWRDLNYFFFYIAMEVVALWKEVYMPQRSLRS